MSILHLSSCGIRLKFVCFAGLVLSSKHAAWDLIQEVLQQALISTLSAILHSTLELLNLGLRSFV